MRRVLVFSLLAFFALGGIALAASKFHEAKPTEYDPAKTNLVQASWLPGIGCPTDAKVFNGTTTSPYSDGACDNTGSDTAGGDSKDKKNEGLLLAKTGPTSNYAASFAVLKDVKSETITELGFDIRKPGPTRDARGSHCGAGAPRFNINGAISPIGCASMTEKDAGNGFIRLRYNGPPISNVDSLSIAFDEGQDNGGPDNFGAAIIDNIDVNGTLVGRGATDAD